MKGLQRWAGTENSPMECGSPPIHRVAGSSPLRHRCLTTGAGPSEGDGGRTAVTGSANSSSHCVLWRRGMMGVKRWCSIAIIAGVVVLTGR